MIEQSAPASTTPVSSELALGDAPLPAPSATPPTRRRPGNDAPPPREALEVGAPCPAVVPAPADGRPAPFDPCGTKGRVSVRWNAYSAALVAPCKMIGVGRTKEPSPTGYVASACVQDGKLWAANVCVMCRMANAGWSATGLIAEMTREQALACQERLGLPAKEPLLTAEAWTKAIAAGS